MVLFEGETEGSLQENKVFTINSCSSLSNFFPFLIAKLLAKDLDNKSLRLKFTSGTSCSIS